MSETSKKFPHPLYEKYVLQPFFKDAETYYYEPMLAANNTHVVMLYRCGILSQENAKALLTALAEVEAAGLDGLDYQSGVEDLFFTIENQLIQKVGVEFGGNIQLARSRNDLGYALTRLALRPMLLTSMQALVGLRAALLKLGYEHLETLMPGYTHTQPAQPTTMAHYMAGILSTLERDMKRLQFAYETNNQSPLGAAALTGTGFPINREMSAKLLGFDSVQHSTYDSIAASDNLTDVAAALTSIGVNLSRFTHDMLFWATQESGAIRIDDSFIQVSSIMPQKRNPVVLEHLRARISRMMAQANGVVIQCHSIPFGDTQDIEDEIFPLLFGGLETSVDILKLYSATVETLHVNVEHLRQRATSGFTTVTELADTLVREVNLPFRQAHKVVSNIVNYALQNDLTPEEITSELLATITADVTGKPINLPEETLQTALDPQQFVLLRSTFGGSAPVATKAVLDNQHAQLNVDAAWIESAQKQLDDAAAQRAVEIQSILEE